MKCGHVRLSAGGTMPTTPPAIVSPGNIVVSGWHWVFMDNAYHIEMTDPSPTVNHGLEIKASIPHLLSRTMPIQLTILHEVVIPIPAEYIFAPSPVGNHTLYYRIVDKSSGLGSPFHMLIVSH